MLFSYFMIQYFFQKNQMELIMFIHLSIFEQYLITN